MKNKKILIIEGGCKKIKVCSVAGGKKKVVTCLYLEQQKAIDMLCAQHYDQLIVSLPRQFFMMRFLELPSQNKKEIEQMVIFQLKKTLPFSLDEVVYDYNIFSRRNGCSEILVFLIEKKKLKKALAPFNEFGKLIDSVVIESDGLANWFIASAGSGMHYPLILVDVEGDSGHFCFLNKQGMVFSRKFFYSDEAQFQHGVRESLQIYEKKFGKLDDIKIVLTGAYDKIFKNTIAIDSLCDQMVVKSGISFNSLLGVDYGAKFDFSPQFICRHKKMRQKIKMYIDGGIVLLEVFVILFILLGGYFFNRYSYLNYLNSELNNMELTKSEFEGLVSKLDVLDKEVNSQSGFSDALYRLVFSFAGDIKISFLDFKNEGDFSVNGYAEEAANVFAAVAELNKDKLFKNVGVQHASKVEGSEFVEFCINGELK
ncbi:MAG: hypothetical protein GY858_00970 [Candidatus Omnitrophica bacterium]|nr:hypothetical protein [Candidatus Omnitrophota bacterium]